jgi:hypothetical protein
MIIQPPSNPDGAPETAEIDRIVASGPQGAIAVAGVAVAAVIALWLAFYWLVFLPRAPLP